MERHKLIRTQEKPNFLLSHSQITHYLPETSGMNDSLWRTYSSEQGTAQTLECGPLQVYLQWSANEIWIASRYRAWPTSPDDGEELADLKWSRWALNENDTDIEVSPTLPSTPLLLKPDDPYRIVPGARTRIYTRIPLWLQIRTAKGKSLLTELPTVTMSNTWFGSTIDGERCLSHNSSVRRFLTDDFFLPHLASCTLEVNNSSPGELRFEKICLRAENMTLFEDNGNLWTDVTTITYKGAGSDGEVSTGGKPPIEARGATIITKPRVHKSASLAVKTFELLRDIRN